MVRRLLITLLLTGVCLGQDVARMEQIIQFYVSNQRFMGAALVAQNGKVLLSKGYGSADLEWDIPNSPSTKFRLGSILHPAAGRARQA